MDKWFEWILFGMFIMSTIYCVYGAGKANTPVESLAKFFVAAVNCFFAVGIALRWLQ